jgi:hypothetical protein
MAPPKPEEALGRLPFPPLIPPLIPSLGGPLCGPPLCCKSRHHCRSAGTLRPAESAP